MIKSRFKFKRPPPVSSMLPAVESEEASEPAEAEANDSFAPPVAAIPEETDPEETEFAIPLPDREIGEEVTLSDGETPLEQPVREPTPEPPAEQPEPDPSPMPPEPAPPADRPEETAAVSYAPAMKEILTTNVETSDGKAHFFRHDSPAETFNGSPGNDSICIDAGPGFYGWNVELEGGPRMSLADLMTYQSLYSRMPASSGTIARGPHAITFTGVKRVYSYQQQTYIDYVKNG